VEQIVEAILGLGGIMAYVVIGLLAFGEAAAFIGLVLPGELAVLLGGVLASQGRVSLPVVLATVAVAAVAGDSAGYEIGRRWGPGLLRWRIARRHAETIREVERYLRRRGGLMVVVGRWTSVLRAIVPGVAGMSRMPYRRFFVFNVIGGVAWAAVFTLAGYIAGESYARVDAATGWGSWLAGAAVLTFVGVRWAVRRRARTPELSGADEDVDVDVDEVTTSTRDEVLI
jgi:membrane protein DedA with SNARE-associated domain